MSIRIVYKNKLEISQTQNSDNSNYDILIASFCQGSQLNVVFHYHRKTALRILYTLLQLHLLSSPFSHIFYSLKNTSSSINMATRRFKKRTCLLISCIFLELQGQQRNKTMSRQMIHTCNHDIYVHPAFVCVNSHSVYHRHVSESFCLHGKNVHYSAKFKPRFAFK